MGAVSYHLFWLTLNPPLERGTEINISYYVFNDIHVFLVEKN